MKIDYRDPANLNKTLWLVYGQKFFPSILCCKLSRNKDGDVVIWGFSVYRRSPSFRTLGRNVATWMESLKATHAHDMFEFYDDQNDAIERLRDITTPGAGAIKRDSNNT